MNPLDELLARLIDPALTDEQLTALTAELAELEDAQLGEFETMLLAHFDALLEGDRNDATLAEARRVGPTITATQVEAAGRYAAADALATEFDALAAEVRGETAPEGEGGEPVEGEPPAEGEPVPAEGEPAHEPGEPAGVEGVETPPAAEGEPVLVAAVPARPAARPSIERVASRVPPARRAPAAPDRPVASIVAAGDVRGFSTGQQLTRDQMAEAINFQADMLRRKGTGMLHAASVVAEYPNNRKLTRDSEATMATLRRDVDSVVASGGACTLYTPLYDVAGISDDSRPFANGLPSYGADRVGVTWIPAPRFGGYTANNAAWTLENDLDPGSDGPETKPCVRVDCDPAESVALEAFPNCVEVGNFFAMGNDERLQAILDIVAAEHSRFQETRMITKVGEGSTDVFLGRHLGATRDFFAGLDLLMAGGTSRWRRRRNVQVRLALPEWARNMFRADLTREIPGSTQERLATADSEFDAMFAVRNISPIWLLDGEAGQVFGAQGNDAVVPWPNAPGGATSELIAYMFHEGDWTHLTGARIDLGVVSDSTLNATNDLQIWSEEFENVFYRGAGDTLRLAFDLCPDGSASAPVDIDVCASGS